MENLYSIDIYQHKLLVVDAHLARKAAWPLFDYNMTVDDKYIYDTDGRDVIIRCKISGKESRRWTIDGKQPCIVTSIAVDSIFVYIIDDEGISFYYKITGEHKQQHYQTALKPSYVSVDDDFVYVTRADGALVQVFYK